MKGAPVPATSSSVSDSRATGTRIVAIGILAIVVILGAAAVFLLLSLPDAGAFDARVERLFVENDDLTSAAEIKLLEILAQSGRAFSETLAGYRMVIFVLMLFATALLVASLVFLVMLVLLNRRMAEIERQGLRVSRLEINREENTVVVNTMGFSLTGAMVETLSALAEARMDDEVLSGAELEGVISGRDAADCEEAAGATRVKRLRDALGNQMVAELLVKTVPKQGYVLGIDKGVIQIV
ncbi:MAG: helix-turn-helix domain-containing protein [Pseudomonadota bacterium]